MQHRRRRLVQPRHPIACILASKPHFERIPCGEGECRDGGPLQVGEDTRHPVHDAQGADVGATRQHDGCAGVETDVWITDDQRILCETVVGGGVLHLEHVGSEDRLRAEGLIARCLRHARQAVIGLEPQPMLIDEGDQRDRRCAGSRCSSDEPVEERLGRRVEHGEGAQLAHPFVFVVRRASAHGFPSPDRAVSNDCSEQAHFWHGWGHSSPMRVPPPPTVIAASAPSRRHRGVAARCVRER